MMTTAVDRATAEFPVRVISEPKTWEDAWINLQAFSDEGREKQRVKHNGARALIISSVPLMKKCFGWLDINGQVLFDLKDRKMRPRPVKIEKVYRELQPVQQYFGIVYEYIPEGINNRATVQAALGFFWGAGFDYMQSVREENWKDSVLVHLSDMVYPLGERWLEGRYRRPDAGLALTFRAPTCYASYGPR